MLLDMFELQKILTAKKMLEDNIEIDIISKYSSME